MNAQREKVTFELNTPQLLTLEFDPPAQARAGKWGEQFMYWLAEEKTLWAEPLLDAKIKATRATAGDQILVTKRKQKTHSGGYIVAWEVSRPSQQAVNQAKAALEASEQLARELTPPAPPRSAPRRLPPATPIDKRLPAEKFAPQSQPGQAPGLMAAALREALDACKEVCWNPNPEDVRSLAITIYIQRCGGRR